jgi:hypothetical protein
VPALKISPGRGQAVLQEDVFPRIADKPDCQLREPWDHSYPQLLPSADIMDHAREPSMTDKAEVAVHEENAYEKKLTRKILFKLDTR